MSDELQQENQDLREKLSAMSVELQVVKSAADGYITDLAKLHASHDKAVQRISDLEKAVKAAYFEAARGFTSSWMHEIIRPMMIRAWDKSAALKSLGGAK